MNLHLTTFNILLMILLCNSCCGSIVESCSKESREQEEMCGKYCYKVVKPLLSYAASVRSKEEQFNEMHNKIRDQEVTILKYEYQCSLNNDKEKLILDLREKIHNNEESNKQVHQHQQASHDIFATQNKAAIVAKLKQEYESNSEQIVRLKSEVNVKDKEIEDKNYQFNAALTEIKTKNIQLALNTAKVVDLKSQLLKMQSPSDFSKCLEMSTDVYSLNLAMDGVFLASCDLVDSGWTIIQRRVDGSMDFNRNWEEYKEGFGDFNGEFFFGLENLHVLTHFEPQELFIYLEDFENKARYARYSHFLIGDEAESYKLKMLGEYSGTAGDSLKPHINMMFSTKDQDNDPDEGNCAESFKSGWWFSSCYRCNLNGKYSKDTGRNVPKIAWHGWHTKPIKFVQMMIRPKSN